MTGKVSPICGDKTWKEVSQIDTKSERKFRIIICRFMICDRIGSDSAHLSVMILHLINY